MRSVVVLPQPEGPSSAKKLPRSISSERSSTADDVLEALGDVVEADVRRARGGRCLRLLGDRHRDARPRAVLDAGAPVVELLPELEVEEALGRDDAVELAHPVGHVEQLPPVGADELDEDVELPRRDDDVAGLVPLRDRLRHRVRRAARADADHRL